jgi:hypothetical protein
LTKTTIDLSRSTGLEQNVRISIQSGQGYTSILRCS